MLIGGHFIIFIGAGATACMGCQQGTFASLNRSTGCLPCPLGSFSVQVAAKSCTSCWTKLKGSCESETFSLCPPHRCNDLRFRANPSISPGEFLCRYGDSANSPEFVCTIPDPNIQQKISCEYEASLLCKIQQLDDMSSIQLKCHPHFSMSP